MKEGITFIMALDGVYEFWSKMFLSWEEKLPLDGICKVPTKPLLIVGKLVLAYFVGFTNAQLIEFGNELLERKVTF